MSLCLIDSVTFLWCHVTVTENNESLQERIYLSIRVVAGSDDSKLNEYIVPISRFNPQILGTEVTLEVLRPTNIGTYDPGYDTEVTTEYLAAAKDPFELVISGITGKKYS